jgi:hypothetical protein
MRPPRNRVCAPIVRHQHIRARIVGLLDKGGPSAIRFVIRAVGIFPGLKQRLFAFCQAAYSGETFPVRWVCPWRRNLRDDFS